MQIKTNSVKSKVTEEDVLKLIKARKNGILQNELWKKLKIDSRACSRLVTALESKGLIKREWETAHGVRTYRIVAVKQQEKEKLGKTNYHLLIAGDIIAPCAGCRAECDPERCQDLVEWVKLLS
ncbi:MAG: MarR family transcriptional regulator [Methanocellales archaeon]